MGLDMWLYKKVNAKKSNEDICENAWEEVAYWRKANQIREWFDNKIGIENCQFHTVTEEILAELVETCKKVLDNPSDAKNILPTSSGFFFGGTDYDEWYFGDLKETIEMVEKVITETDWEHETVAYYEWW